MNIDPVVVWIAIVILGIGTYALRAVFLLGVDYLNEIPPAAEELLPYVPVAILAALISPYFAYFEGSFALGISNPQFVAGGIAILVAWKTENLLLTVGAGMVVLWIIQWGL